MDKRTTGKDRTTPRRVDFELKEMIDNLRQRGIGDERVLAAMEIVDRKEFVQHAFSARAYDDSALPIGHAQTISQPFTVAFMTQALCVEPDHKVLEIGTGSGYQAALLAAMGARVFTIERHMDLLTAATKRFEQAGYNVASKCGDGTIGWKEFAPYNGIIVTAGGPEVPPALPEQLAEGGILVIPIGSMEVQNLHIIERRNDSYFTHVVEGFKFVPLIGKRGWK
jgi:protein-L-isoaspartate(D-aspartate) O-methyltransferase